MSLKTRLIFSFAMMIFMTVFLGVLLMASSWVLRSRYLAYNRDRQLFDLLSETTLVFEKQRKALDSYLIGSEASREEYRMLQGQLSRQMEDWAALAYYPSEREELNRLKGLVRGLESGTEQVIRLVETGKRAEAVAVMDKSILSQSDGAAKFLRAAAVEKKTQSEKSWLSAKKLAARTTTFSILLLASVILAGTGFSILLFKAVSDPLAKLREGIRKISKGERDLKIDLTEPVEIAELARAFEEMAGSLSSLQSQILQMGRMSAVGTLAGGVAHEINNPLTGVLGQAQLLLEKMPADDPKRANVEKIERAAQRCRKIVRGLLDFSRPSDYAFEFMAVDDLVASSLSLCETEMRASRIELVWKKNPALPKVFVSAHHLQQVFLNLMTNSMHAMPGGGKLEIESRLREAEALPEDDVSEGGRAAGLVEIVFQDSGAGIHPDHLPHIFDPFFTTKEPGKGTGLGLSISYGIVLEHRGQILAQSKGPGQGAAFVIRLPVLPENVSQDPQEWFRRDRLESAIGEAEKRLS